MEGTWMKARTTGRHVHSLRVGQKVEVRRGTLAGFSGVLIGFSPDRNCRIQLDTVERGVVLVIDPAAIRVRPLVSQRI